MAAAAFAATALGSCSDEKFEPGEAVDPDSPAVSFVGTQKTYLCGSKDSEYLSTVMLHRENTDGALTVDIDIIHAENELQIPSKVTFAPGESSASLEIRLDKDAEILVQYPFTIAIDSKYSDPYADGPGVCMFSSSVVVANAYIADCYFYYAKDYVKTASDNGHFKMQVLQTAATEFVLKDFMSCGKDLTIKVGADKVPEISGDIAYWDADYACWDIYDEESDDFRLYFSSSTTSYMDELYMYKSGSAYSFRESDKRNQLTWQVYEYIIPNASNGMWDWMYINWYPD